MTVPPTDPGDLREHIDTLIHSEVEDPAHYDSESLCYQILDPLTNTTIEAVINSTPSDGWLAIKGSTIDATPRTIFVHLDYDRPQSESHPVLLSVPGDTYYDHFARASSVPWADPIVETAWPPSPVEAAHATTVANTPGDAIIREDTESQERCAFCRVQTHLRYRLEGADEDMGACAGCLLDSLIDEDRHIAPSV